MLIDNNQQYTFVKFVCASTWVIFLHVSSNFGNKLCHIHTVKPLYHKLIGVGKKRISFELYIEGRNVRFSSIDPV